MNIEKVIENLKKREIEAYHFESRSELEKFLENEVDDAKTIAFGGSMTLKTLGLYEKFSEMGKEVIWHWETAPEKRKEALKKASNADIYFSSSNAITQDGRLVNIDGNGNRVAAMAFGIPKVIIIAGKNKICQDLDSAIKRIKQEACPQNAKRLGLNVPCAVASCVDCRSKERMCRVTTIIEGCPNMSKMIVCLLDEDLGF